ncbi:hypothetical protein BJ742DRAFT_767717 [Cladochytrium replicatum]|nr:hypothetical protein BJ742DRAFT_767717 [Cladochytrium replicatum]
MHWTASLGRLAIVDTLLKRGANSQITNVGGETALMRSVMLSNNSDAASFPTLLHILRDSWDMTDESQKSVLHHIAIVAGLAGKAESARKTAKAFVDAKDGNGDSALHVASQDGGGREGGEKSGVKALDLARESESWTCVKALRRRLSAYPVRLETTDSEVSDVSLTEDTGSVDRSQSGESEEGTPADRSHRFDAAMTAFNLCEVLDLHLRAQPIRHDDTITLAIEELDATQKLLAESDEELETLRDHVGEIEAAKGRVEEFELLMKGSIGNDEGWVDGGNGTRGRSGTGAAGR